MVVETRRTQKRAPSPSPPPRRADPSHAHSETASSRPRAPPLSGNPSVPASVSCRSDNRHSVSSLQTERDAAIARLVEVQIQMQQNQEEFRRELRQIALSIAKAEKRPTVNDKAQEEPAFPMGPLLLSPSPLLHQGTRMGTNNSGPAGAGSGQRTGGSGAAGFGSAPVGIVPTIHQFEFKEGFDRSVDARNLRLWQYERFVKNGGRSFQGKLDAEEAFLWISSAIGVFDSMACPMEHRVRIITGAFQDEARIWWDSVINSTFAHKQLQDITWDEFRAEFDGKYFPPHVMKRKDREFQMLKQGQMTVVQYETRFRALERFAPDLVSTEQRRIERFYEGLQYEIRVAYVNRVFATFGDIVRAAREAERVLATRPRRDYNQKQQHPRPYQLDQEVQQRRRTDAPVAMRAMDAQAQDGMPPPCQTCGRRHGGVCRAGTGTCFNCGQLGHRAAICPTSQRQPVLPRQPTLPAFMQQRQQQRGKQ